MAFTLIETLIVMAIIAVLLALLFPALRATRDAARELNCASNLRSVSIEFQYFASNESLEGQGDSTALGASRFRINDFQDSLYHLDEFWDLNGRIQSPLRTEREPAMCPAGTRLLTKVAGFPCGGDAIRPVEGVSYGMNMRLYRGQLTIGNASVLAPVNLSSLRANVLDHPYVPLMMDVDGDLAASRGIEPFYLAPPVENEGGPLSSGRYWMPSERHPGGVNVGFVGGHVLRSRTPERETWNWSYRANVGS